MSRFFSQPERRALTWTDVWGSDTSLPMTTYAGKSISESSALKLSTVWAAATLVADAISGLQFEAITINEKGETQDVELPQWIRKPHPELRRMQFWNQVMLSLLLWGNAYMLILRRPSDGQIIGLKPLKPNSVHVEWDPSKPGYRRYQVDGSNVWVGSETIMHMQGPTLPGEVKGMSVIAQAREAIGLGLTLEEFGARYFAQGSMAKVVIQSKAAMDDNEARKLVRIYEKFHRGPGNWHRPAVLAGEGEIKNISIPPEDAQFLQSREFQALDVARWFRVPPHRVGIVSKQSSWGSGLAEENVAMVQMTYRPWILRIEETLTAYTPGGEGRGLEIRLMDSTLLRGTWAEQVEAWGAAVMGRLVTPNEARKALGYGPLPDGDKLTEVTDLKGSVVNPKTDKAKKEADRERKQEENSFVESDRPKGVASGAGSARHLPGKHSQKSHGGGRVSTGTRMSDLDAKGQQAVKDTMDKYGVTMDGLKGEIRSGITPETLAAGRAWYGEAHGEAQSLAKKHGVSVDQAAAILSATSPRTPWPRNKMLADRVLARHKEFPDGTGKEAAKKIGGGLSNNLGPGVEIARGGSIDQHLTGVKRRSFYNNILEPETGDDVTVDTWMQRAAMKTSSKGMTLDDSVDFVSAKKAATGGAGAGYVAIAEATREVAGEMGIRPHEAQAAYWITAAGSKDGKWGDE